jgi:hypothetical protein
MTTKRARPGWPNWVARCAWVAVFLLLRTHYFLSVIVGPVFGWR